VLQAAGLGLAGLVDPLPGSADEQEQYLHGEKVFTSSFFTCQIFNITFQ